MKKVIEMRKKCVMCKDRITDRNIRGNAKTCDQKCAGKLAWKTR